MRWAAVMWSAVCLDHGCCRSCITNRRLFSKGNNFYMTVSVSCLSSADAEHMSGPPGFSWRCISREREYRGRWNPLEQDRKHQFDAAAGRRYSPRPKKECWRVPLSAHIWCFGCMGLGVRGTNLTPPAAVFVWRMKVKSPHVHGQLPGFTAGPLPCSRPNASSFTPVLPSPGHLTNANLYFYYL